MEKVKTPLLDHSWKPYDEYHLRIISKSTVYTDYKCENCAAIKSEAQHRTVYLSNPNINDDDWEENVLNCGEILLNSVLE